jgi:hypothetical protein
MLQSRYLFLVLVIANFLLIGCTGLQTFPNAARAGDTVALAIGSPDGADRSNTTAVFVSKSDPGYPSAPVEYPLTIRSLFRLYGDKASIQYQRNNTAKQIIDTSGHEPWLTAAAIDLPTNLPPGPGEVRFTTTADYPTVNSHINDVPIDLEILPAAAGMGSPGLFPIELGVGQSGYGDLLSLEPQTHTVIHPVFLGQSNPWPDYGAIEIKVSMPTTTLIADRSLRVNVDDMSMTTDSKRSVISRKNGDDLTVMLLSPSGKLKYYEARMEIVLPTGGAFSGTPTITAVNYYDVDGNVSTGPAINDYVIEVR